MSDRFAKYTPEIQFVSLGTEPEAAGYFWQAAVGALTAHAVYYGEGGVGAVFTPNAPMERTTGLLGRPVNYSLSLTAKAQMEDAVWDACRQRGIDSEGLVDYMRPMKPVEAELQAEGEQQHLVSSYKLSDAVLRLALDALNIEY